MRRWVLLTVIFLGPAASAAAGETVLEVIPLKHRTAEEIVPLLRPFVGEEGAVSGANGQLVLRTTPANLEQIRNILSRVDTPPRRLLISVRFGAAAASGAAGAEAVGTIRLPGNTRMQVGGAASPGDGRGARLRIYGTSRRADETAIQQVQGLEGAWAYVHTGRAIPLFQRSITVTGGQTVVTDSLQYREVTTGFHVRPRVHGDRVTLEIGAQRERAGAGGGEIRVQRVLTTVRGRLGEWMTLGGAMRESAQKDSAIVRRTAEREEDKQTAYIKVEEIGGGE